MLFLLLFSSSTLLEYTTDKGNVVDLSDVKNVPNIQTTRLKVGDTDYALDSTGPNSLFSNTNVASDVSTSTSRGTAWFWIMFLVLLGLILATTLILLFAPCWLILCCCNPQPPENDGDCGPGGCQGGGHNNRPGPYSYQPYAPDQWGAQSPQPGQQPQQPLPQGGTGR
jgi:hypothetical protein